jgi:predicted Zn-dependent peptidase
MHLLEHLMLKTSKERSRAVLLADIDSIGGQVNAYTARDYICLYGKVANHHVPRLIRIISEIILNNHFSDKQVANENSVILDELNAINDNNEQIAFETSIKAVYPKSSLSNSIIGVLSVNGERLGQFKSKHLTGDKTLAVMVGGYTPNDQSMLTDNICLIEKATSISKPEYPKYVPNITVLNKQTEQNVLFLAFNAYPLIQTDTIYLRLLGSIIGSGYASLLNRSLREEHGLCYSVYSYIIEFINAGLLGICIYYDKHWEKKLLAKLNIELLKFLNQGISSELLYKVKEQYIANMIIEYDSVDTISEKLALDIIYGHTISTKSEGALVCSSEAEKINFLAKQIIRSDSIGGCIMGNVSTSDFYFHALCF